MRKRGITMKKSVFLFLFIIIVAAFSGCSNNGSDSNTSTVSEDKDENGTAIVPPGPDKLTQVYLPSRGIFISPAGYQIPVGDLPLGMAMSPDERILAVTNNGYGEQFVSIIDTQSRDEIQRLPLDNAFYGITFSLDGKNLYVSSGNDQGIIVYGFKDGKFTVSKEISVITQNKDYVFTAGLAPSPVDPMALYVVCNLENSLAIVDLEKNIVKQKLPVAVNIPIVDQFAPQAYPLDVTVLNDGSKVYVSNWGGDVITVIKPDLLLNKAVVTKRIKVGSHPSDMVISPDGQRLFVANANSDTVSIISTKTDEVTGTISLSPYLNAPLGSQPNALAISPDGKTLYVANANNNDVAVIDVSSNIGKITGLIPVGWYPTALILSKDGKTLYVANGQGSMSKPNPDREYIADILTGTVSIIQVPDKNQLAEYTLQVERNNGFNEGVHAAKLDGWSDGNPIPKDELSGSPIKHVIYVIKENRTYDQVLGDMPEGNGDKNLCLFGEKVTPNTHALAREFVLLDNFYSTGEVSVDGHEWLLAGVATDMCEKTWPSGYSERSPGLDLRQSGGYGLAPRPDSGYIWDMASRKGVSYRVYGEYDVFGLAFQKEVLGHADPFYLGWEGFYTQLVFDPDRAKEFLREFNWYSNNDMLPQLMIVLLPDNHTYGTMAGVRTPKSYVANNDLGLGMIVDGVSHSKNWNDTAIFVLEDDAQDGPDHVDCHRIPALVISPYTRRHFVDHAMYNTVSMLRTIELILGMPPMTQFDANAQPMFTSFAETPDITPFTHLANTYPLDEKNPADAIGAAECATWNWSMPDSTPPLRHNELIWKSIKGANSKMPAPRHNISLNLQEDDD
jgi:YVTN family beta-propeller protein